MQLRLLFFGCILLVAKGYCQSLNDATIATQSGQTLHSTVGGIVLISCHVDNLMSGGKVNWIFVKHSLTIFHGDHLMVDDSRYTIKHPPYSNVYDLQIFPAEESDQGSYKCEVDGTKKAVTIELVLEGAPQVPQVDTTPLNRTGCCMEQGVNDNCLKACYPSSLNDTFDAQNSCSATDVLKLVHCGSDGRNHENCCAGRNIPALCLAFCSNDVQRMSGLTDEELACLSYADDIISCYEFGAVTLPGPPREVSVLPRSSADGHYGLLVSWKPPVLNPSAVTGYRISYKKTYEAKFRTTAVQGATTGQFTINDLLVNTEYSVYVTAVGHHGSSQPLYQINTVLEDTSQPGLATDVLSCCVQRRVASLCQTLLCHPRVWATFNTTSMLQCYHFLPDVFTCLAGGRNHTPCCTDNNVPEPCLGMCSGQPPPFNSSVAQCIPKLSTIEACVQLGLDSLPSPPVQVRLHSVSAHEALVMWNTSEHSGNTPIQKYYVQLRRGNESARWVTVDVVYGTYIQLTNLTETENYAVQVIAQNMNDSSLPSETLRFTTYPEILSGTDRPVVPHNVTQCCIDSGMPRVCAMGCSYQNNITDYYAAHLLECFSHIGQVLACGSDGRNHSACCEREGVQPLCLKLCSHTKIGELDPSFYQCIWDTAIAVTCFKEGLEDLVRMPDNVTVTNITTQHAQIEWLAPKTGPRPEKYIVFYKNINTGANKTDETMGKLYILQNLMPSTQYEIKVASYLNNSRSPFTNVITFFTPVQDIHVVPGGQTATGLGLWNNRTHCCQSSGIWSECQPVCLNQPVGAVVDCNSEMHKILVCSSDGKDHSLCCQAAGLAAECIALCGRGTVGNFSVQTASCLADASLGIITSCFLSNANLVPSPPAAFSVDSTEVQPKLWWKGSTLNCGAPEICSYDVHYWPADNRMAYRTVLNAVAPYTVPGLPVGGRFTFTVTARNSKGSSAAAPWQTVTIVAPSPDVSIAQDPNEDIHEVGTYIGLVCDAFGFSGTPSFTWTYFGREMGRERRLNVGRITEDSEGNYTCTVATRNISISVNSYLNIRFKPHQVYIRTDTVSPNVGGDAVLACWFRGFPFSNTTATTWTKDGQLIQVSSSKYSSTVQERLHKGITAFRLKIANVVPSDYGSYKCSVYNQYGSATGSTDLMDPDIVPPQVTPGPLVSQNITGCCSRNGMPEPCMRICRFEVDPAAAVSNPAEYGVCLYFFQELVNCAADGADHTTCCRNGGVHPYCWPFCAGKVPQSENVFNDPQLLQCVNQAPTMFNCLARGYNRIPTAPTQVIARLESDAIVVRWNLPRRNPDRVEFYRIYYNFTGNPAPQIHFVQYTTMTYTIEDLLPDHIYNVWLVAGNDNGESHPSELVTVSVHVTLPMPPTKVIATVIDGTGVAAQWLPPQQESTRVDGYVVFYKPANDVKISEVHTRANTIRIFSLKPETDYVLYVKSVNAQGIGPVASNIVHFKTGVYTGGTTAVPGEFQAAHRGSQITGAQIAGIVLAIVAAAAFSTVIFLLVSKSRIQKQKMNESVSFENPGYGNQQVRISGLPVENPYDNVMQPDEDGSFGYSRLNEDQIAAAADSAKSMPAMDYPATKYVHDTPAGVNLEANGTTASQEVATLPVSDMTTQDRNESTT